jgi:hypothetical protein
MTRNEWLSIHLEHRRAMRRLVQGQSMRLISRCAQYITPQRFNITQAKLALDALISKVEDDLRKVKELRADMEELNG